MGYNRGMSERVGRHDSHLAVKREVLVRYLDAWTSASLRSRREATYVTAGDNALVADALRVFREFADRLDGHHLNVVIIGDVAEWGEVPAGLSVRSVTDPSDVTVTAPVLALLNVVEDGTLTEADAWRVVASVAGGTAREVLLTLPAAEQATDCCERMHAAGLAYTVAVELVADDGRAQLLVFATGDLKHLATFKQELWAADDFAGIRYRDPRDAERTLVGISLTPQLRPLRRELLAELARRGRCTVAELQHHVLLETIYRPADAIGALTSALSAGVITREPAKGRLTPRTVVSHREGDRQQS